MRQQIDGSIRTGSPFCCADLDSRRLKTSPPTEHSRHGVVPGFSVLPPTNSPFGCIIKMPFVVRPSISTLSCHFVAFSYHAKSKWKRECEREREIEKGRVISSTYAQKYISARIEPSCIDACLRRLAAVDQNTACESRYCTLHHSSIFFVPWQRIHNNEIDWWLWRTSNLEALSS